MYPDAFRNQTAKAATTAGICKIYVVGRRAIENNNHFHQNKKADS